MKISKHDRLLMTLTKNSYEKIAADFSASRKFVWPDLGIFLDYVKDGDRVLDLGCGNGRLSELFKNKKISYLGIDPVKGLIAEAKKKYPKLDFKFGDILTFKTTEKFDAIVCAAVLNHLPGEELQLTALKNILKLLKPGGCLLMSNWNLYNTKNPKGIAKFKGIVDLANARNFEKSYGIKKTELRDRDVLTKWGDGKVLYYYAFDKTELNRLVKASGLKVVENYYSLDGQISVKNKGANIVTIARAV
jgi:2-polyprenyl-3-methyl-5-hydroxy-6-metoxy-1,4-benzoquinol methylase